jgi:transposase
MLEQAIKTALDLEGLEVVGIAAFEELIELVVESRFEAGSCRTCGGIAAEPKERPEILVRDLPMSGRTVVLRWRKRRWRCGYCGSTWTETHPEIPARARMTLRFKRHLAARPQRPATSPGSRPRRGSPTTAWRARTRREPHWCERSAPGLGPG